ncbi:MAG: thiamine pyrophosphate-dependent enzyme [Candidatus Promineifilaceae bacterium]
MTELDRWLVYRQMLRSRLLEQAVAALWQDGLISGEMHLGTGEEAIVAGSVLQLEDGDAMALDHRGTSAMLMRGVEPVSLLREFLGHPDGLCQGMGGHMHLFSRQHLAASSGIVGSSGPAAAGFALAARKLRPGTVALAFFGEGAVNEGMMMEAMNLAVVWRLPVVFICKDNSWAIATPTASATAADAAKRAEAFGLPSARVDGTRLDPLWDVMGEALDRARAGQGPSFVQAQCRHFAGHMLLSRSQPMLDRRVLWPIVRAAVARRGGPLSDRISSVRRLISIMRETNREQSAQQDDPLPLARRSLRSDPERLQALEAEVIDEIQSALVAALGQREV